MAYLDASFTGSDGSSINSYSPEVGSGFIAQTGFADGEIKTNRLYIPNANIAYRSATAATDANQFVEAVWYNMAALANDRPAILARAQAGQQSFYSLEYLASAGEWRIYRSAAGVKTQLGSGYADTIAVGQSRTARLTVFGTGTSVTLIAKIDGIDRISTSDSSVDRITSAGFSGFGQFGAVQSATAGLHLDQITAQALVVPVLKASYSRNFGRDTRAGHGATPLTNVVADNLSAVASYDTAIISGTAAHWQGLGTGKTSFPTPASNGSLSGTSYVCRVTVISVDGISQTIDVSISVVSTYTPPANHSSNAWLATKLASDPIAPTKFYTVSSITELNAIKTLISNASGSPSVVYFSKGLASKPAIVLTVWNAVPAGWVTFKNEDDNEPCELLTFRFSGDCNRINAEKLKVSSRKSELTVVGFGLSFAAGPVIANDIQFIGSTTDPADFNDGYLFGTTASWSFISAHFEKFVGGTIGTTNTVNGETYIDQIYLKEYTNNAMASNNTGDVTVNKMVVAGSAVQYDTFGFHQDAWQANSGRSMSGKLKIKEALIFSGGYYTMQCFFGPASPSGGVEIENMFYCGRSVYGFAFNPLIGAGYIKNFTLVAQPHAVSTPYDQAGQVGQAPAINIGTNSSCTVALARGFVHNSVTRGPNTTASEMVVLNTTNKNLDLSAYFVDPIQTTTPSTSLNIDELEALYRAAYSPKPGGPLDLGGGRWVGAFKPGGLNNDTI